jgi:hypothetical protein
MPPVPSSCSGALGDGRALSAGKKPEVGDGRTSLKRAPDWLAVKLLVFHAKAELPGRGNSLAGVVGCRSANETEGNDGFRLG